MIFEEQNPIVRNLFLFQGLATKREVIYTTNRDGIFTKASNGTISVAFNA